MKLDPVKGFVATTNKKSDRKRAKRLNKVLKYKELPNNYASGHTRFNTTQAIIPYLKKPIYIIELGIKVGESIVIDSTNSKESSFSMGLVPVLALKTKRLINHSAAWSFGVTAASYDHEVEQEGVSVEGDDIEEDRFAFGLKLGLDYRLIKGIIFSSHLYYEQSIFILGFYRSEFEGLMFKQKALGLKRFEVKGEAELFWGLEGSVAYQSIFSGGDEMVYVEDGKSLEVFLKWPFGKKKNHSFNFSFKEEEYQLSTLLFATKSLKLTYGLIF